MPINIPEDKERRTRPLRNQRVSTPRNLGDVVQTMTQLANAIDSIVHKLWGNGDVGLITGIEILKERMVTKDYLDAKFDDFKNDLMTAVKADIAIAVLEHSHNEAGDTKPKTSLVEAARDAGIDLPKLLDERNRANEAAKKAEHPSAWTKMVQINDFIRAWPIIWIFFLAIFQMLAGGSLKDIVDLLRQLGQP